MLDISDGDFNRMKLSYRTTIKVSLYPPSWLSFSSHFNTAAVATLPKFDEAAIAQLESFGFPLIRCQKALLATGNSNAEAAVDWLFAHSEDPGKYCTYIQYMNACWWSYIFRHWQPYPASCFVRTSKLRARAQRRPDQHDSRYGIFACSSS